MCEVEQHFRHRRVFSSFLCFHDRLDRKQSYRSIEIYQWLKISTATLHLQYLHSMTETTQSTMSALAITFQTPWGTCILKHLYLYSGDGTWIFCHVFLLKDFPIIDEVFGQVIVSFSCHDCIVTECLIWDYWTFLKSIFEHRAGSRIIHLKCHTCR